MPLIEATEEELVALRQLLHRAVLHSGMEAAEAAILWNRKIVQTLQTVIKPNGGAQIPKETQ